MASSLEAFDKSDGERFAFEPSARVGYLFRRSSQKEPDACHRLMHLNAQATRRRSGDRHYTPRRRLSSCITASARFSNRRRLQRRVGGAPPECRMT
jgi:hypothetical protein